MQEITELKNSFERTRTELESARHDEKCALDALTTMNLTIEQDKKRMELEKINLERHLEELKQVQNDFAAVEYAKRDLLFQKEDAIRRLKRVSSTITNYSAKHDKREMIQRRFIDSLLKNLKALRTEKLQQELCFAEPCTSQSLIAATLRTEAQALQHRRDIAAEKEVAWLSAELKKAADETQAMKAKRLQFEARVTTLHSAQNSQRYFRIQSSHPFPEKTESTSYSADLQFPLNVFPAVGSCHSLSTPISPETHATFSFELDSNSVKKTHEKASRNRHSSSDAKEFYMDFDNEILDG